MKNLEKKWKYSVPLKENHRALWTWIGNNPGKDKFDWPGWKTLEKLGIDIDCQCFACQDTTNRFPGLKNVCPVCILGKRPGYCCEGLYELFEYFQTEKLYHEAAEIAKLIVDLWD